jgi:hypothetical protein
MLVNPCIFTHVDKHFKSMQLLQILAALWYLGPDISCAQTYRVYCLLSTGDTLKASLILMMGQGFKGRKGVLIGRLFTEMIPLSTTIDPGRAWGPTYDHYRLATAIGESGVGRRAGATFSLKCKLEHNA